MFGKNKIQFALFLTIAFILWGAIGLSLSHLWSIPAQKDNGGKLKPGQSATPLKYAKANNFSKSQIKDSFNLLVIGVDRRKGDIGRTDTIMLYRVDFKNSKARLLSIPRDTILEIPGRGMDKVNHAYFLGGIELSKEALEKFFEIKIDHYIEADFEGFINLIDQLGGVTVNVEKDMREIGLEKGVHKLDGKQALAYVRDRNDKRADLARVNRQQGFIKALLKELKGYTPKYQLLKQVPKIYETVETDFSLMEVYSLYERVERLEVDEKSVEILPGSFYDFKGKSYWKPDKEKTTEIVQRIFR